MSKDLWYRYVSDCDGTLTVSTCDLVQYDTKLVVYAASSACPTSATPIAACSDNELGCANAASSVRINTVPGAIHFIRVGGVDGGGPGAFDVACQPRCVGDFNDDRNVDGIDLGVLLSLWGSSASSGGDLNNDGVIDGIDLGILLSRWGLGCP
jgi:hypothetical protein